MVSGLPFTVLPLSLAILSGPPVRAQTQQPSVLPTAIFVSFKVPTSFRSSGQGEPNQSGPPTSVRSVTGAVAGFLFGSLVGVGVSLAVADDEWEMILITGAGALIGAISGAWIMGGWTEAGQAGAQRSRLLRDLSGTAIPPSETPSFPRALSIDPLPPRPAPPLPPFPLGRGKGGLIGHPSHPNTRVLLPVLAVRASPLSFRTSTVILPGSRKAKQYLLSWRAYSERVDGRKWD